MSKRGLIPLKQIKQWLDGANRGTSLVYHRGPSFFNEDDKPAVAKAFWQLYEQGAVLLTQRRVEEGVYEYIATRC